MDGKAAVSDFLRAGLTDEEERTRIIALLANQITDGESSLLRLVSDLGDYLVEEDASLRSKSMRLLEGVLSALPRDNLNGQHVTVMVQFFCDRMSDDVCTMEALAALVSLSHMTFFATQDAEKVASHLLSQPQEPNKLPQRTRFQIYTLYDSLMSTQRSTLKSFGTKFVNGFTNFMSGEKDPRNLMLAFSIMRIILAEFEIDESKSNLFDSVYCYFPITFRPQPNEPCTITTDDLKLRLRQCLAATPKFAPFLIPVLIEKLNAVAVSVKKDTLLTLIACSDVYDSGAMDIYTSQLWASLRFEIIQAEDDILEELVLEALSAITYCMCRGLTHMPKSGNLSRWLQIILTDINAQLREPELKSAKPCGKILFSVAKPSTVCLSVVIQAVLPGLIAICQESDSSDKNANLLSVVLNLIKASSACRDDNGRINPQQPSCLSAMKTDLLELLIPILINFQMYSSEIQDISVQCLQCLVLAHNLLNDHEAEQVVKHFIIITIEDVFDKHNSVMVGLGKIAKARPHLILEHAFPNLLAKLPNNVDKLNVFRDRQHVEHILKALSELSSEKVIFDCLVIRIFSRIDTCIAAAEPCSWYTLRLLSTLRHALKHYIGSEAQFYDKVVPVLCAMVFNNPTSELTTPDALRALNNIVNISTQGCSFDKQTLIASNFGVSFGIGGQRTSTPPSSLHFEPFEESCNDDRKLNTISIFVATVTGLRRDIPLISKLNRDLISTALTTLNRTTNQYQRDSLYVLLASLINKCMSDSDVTDFLQSNRAQLMSDNPDHLDLIFWIAKGLILRCHEGAKTLTDHLIDLMAHSKLCHVIADKFETLLTPHEFLNKDNHARIRPLNKQKFYDSVVPRLVKELTAAQIEHRTSFLTALSTTIANTPKAVYIADLANIFPVLLQCMDISSSEIKRSAISTILSIGFEGKDVIGSHLSTLVPSLLLSTELSPYNSPRVRIAALQLLGFLVDCLRADKLQPYKIRIIRALEAVLDDKRRLVRKEAVLTRQKYFVAC